MQTSTLLLFLLLLMGDRPAGQSHLPRPLSLDHQIETPPEPIATWHVETVDSTANLDKVTSLALDSLGRPHIAYPQAYAYRTPLPPLSLRKQATPAQDLRNNDTLTYTLTPTASYSPTLRAVVWEGTLPTDTVPTIRFQVTPGITGTGSLLLATPITNTARLTDTEHGRSRRATVIVNGRRVYLPLIVRSP
jgi:hypothetical protein